MLQRQTSTFQFVVKEQLVGVLSLTFCPGLTVQMVDNVYDAVKRDLNSGEIWLDEVIQLFQTLPETVLEWLVVVEPIRKCAETSGLPLTFEMKETVLDKIMETEKKGILSKLKTIHEKMVDEGLDKLVVEFPEAVSVNSG